MAGTHRHITLIPSRRSCTFYSYPPKAAMAPKRQDFGTFLQFRFGRRQLARHHRTRKADPPMRSVAKRFILRMAAAAQGNDRAARQSESCSGRIQNLKFALDAEGTVVLRKDFRARHLRIVAPCRRSFVSPRPSGSPVSALAALVTPEVSKTPSPRS